MLSMNLRIGLLLIPIFLNILVPVGTTGEQSDLINRDDPTDWQCRTKGKVSCRSSCSHGMIFYSVDDCCRCQCEMNFAAIGSTHCSPAEWTQWNNWSSCISTEWGGLQTRERICKSNGKEAPGSCAGRGSQSRECSEITKGFRVRKNVRHLTDYELHDIIQAMTKFKKDRSSKGYRTVMSWHGYPGVCHWYHHLRRHEDNHCSWHHHPLFLPWHRLVVLQAELGLQRFLKNKTIGMPYWDWTEPSDDIPYLLRNPKIYDPILKKEVGNPFYRSFVKKRDGVNVYTRRNIWYPGVLMDEYILKGIVAALLSHNYFRFDHRLAKNPHDQIHNCFCYKSPDNDSNWCSYGMLVSKYASWDPTFLLHHSALDRIFAMRRHLEENAGISDWTRSRCIGQYTEYRDGDDQEIDRSFDKPMSPFCNVSMNHEKVTSKHGVWTMHKSYYNEQLFGYKFDNFDLGVDFKWKDLNRDFQANNIKRSHIDDDALETKYGILQEPFCREDSVFSRSAGCRISC